MGEVYRARDPRLGREVAVKVLPAQVACDPERLARFEREARAVAALNHPNILTVYDVGTERGDVGAATADVAVAAIPYVVTELLQGETLREMVSHRAPSQRQVLGFAVQIAQGLDAAHAKGIVHRDIKPANVFITTDGRVKVLDFGLAKLADKLTADSVEATESSPTGAGQVVGTVGYMSPEQVRGLPIDHRTDVFSFGVVLYELLSGRHPFRRETTIATLSAILDERPAELSSLNCGVPPALSGIVARCLQKDRGQRFHSAHDLALSLEAVLAAPARSASLEQVEEKSPYPGLSSFAEKDAAFFFGREAEIRALWQRLQNRKLLAVIGPSGTGKTSFVRAGVMAAAPEGWRCLWVSPGNRPFPAMVRALVPELSSDPETLQRLVGAETNDELVSAIGLWRRRHGEVLLIVDQFEELFTLNPGEVQERFAVLLGQLASAADVHVLVSLRDDFLMRSQEQPPLRPILGELTALLPLSVDSLRRALVEPAKARGYGFDDEALVGEMVESVEGARAALPLLAFAVSRLWEKRDREKKLLMRAAYEEIGGVAGALAQHAEATMDRIGTERQGIVREVFRNLVTAQGTRAVAEREELLSAFPERTAAEEVLRELVDARLVTSYELEGREGEPSHHRIEVVHESLLKAWPRLVRWQAQDEDGAVLRDQLKQAAHLWQEKRRTIDLLWTGTAFREFELWRERYAGALTALEEDFARAMAERAQRQRRLRRLVAGAVLAAALVVAVVTGGLWRRSEGARERARAEALRAEAGKLLALGRTHLEADPTAALAYAKGSLDLYDTPEARRFALEVLWRGPVARVLSLEQAAKQLHLPEEERGIEPTLTMSPDGRWLVAKRADQPQALLFPSDGGPPRALPIPAGATTNVLAFGPRSDLLITPGSGQTLKYSSLPDLRELRTVKLAGVGSWTSFLRGERLFVQTPVPGSGTDGKTNELLVQELRLPEGEPKVVATLHTNDVFPNDADPTGTEIVVCAGGYPYLTVGLLSLERTPRLRILGRLTAQCWAPAYSPRGDRVATTDLSGETRIWSTAEGATNPTRILRGPEFVQSSDTLFDPRGSRVSQAGPYGTESVWDLDEIPDARPFVLGRPGPSTYVHGLTYDPSSRWMATGGIARATIDFWAVSNPRRRELPGFAASYSLGFTPDGRWLATCAFGSPSRLWPLSAGDGSARNLGAECGGSLAIHPSGQVLAAAGFSWVSYLPFPGGRERVLAVGGEPGFSAVAFDREGRRAVAVISGTRGPAQPGQRVLRVWDLPSGREQRHSIAHLLDADWSGFNDMAFAPDGSLYVAGKGGVRRLRLPTEPGGTVSAETVYAAGVAQLNLSRDGKLLLVTAGHSREQMAVQEELLLLDLAGHSPRRITTHGSQLQRARLSASGRVIVTGGADGILRAGKVSGEEPHLLFGHKGPVFGLAISPDERWIASSSDESISIWPMPDVTRPPLHTLSHAELLAKLDALTNLRVVRDEASSTGWKLDVGRFPGWKDVPSW
jgi:WD40 repeat protein